MDETSKNEVHEELNQFRKEWEQYRHERNERLHNFFVKVIVIFALLGITVSVSAYFTFDTAQKNKTALCAMRNDAERRLDLGREFRMENPNGIPGISINAVRRSMNAARETIKSLESLDCPPIESFRGES